MKRYERYKPSGIAWLGDVPSHWEVKRLKFLAKIQNGADYKHIETDEGYPVIGSGGQFAYASHYLYKGESVLLGRKGTIDKPLYVNGAFWTVDTMYYTEIFNNTYPKFLYYLTLTVDFWRYSTQTALPSMTQTALNNLIFAVPNYEEQTAIADYLDSKLSEIDTLIAKQQILLDKLAEQRTAAITAAVCRGLNPDVPMKNSGIEWLGDVPEHWEVINLKYLCCVKGGYAFASDHFSDEGIPVIRISDILFDGTVDSINCKRIPLELAPEHKDSQLSNGQLVMAMTGATIGKVSTYSSEEPAYINQRVGKFDVLNLSLNYTFLGYILRTSGYQEHIKLTAFGGAQPNISDSEMVDYSIAFPSLEEQTAIADYLDQETSKIDRLCDIVRQAVSRLKEYRTALITQAVTGKIKVV